MFHLHFQNATDFESYCQCVANLEPSYADVGPKFEEAYPRAEQQVNHLDQLEFKVDDPAVSNMDYDTADNDYDDDFDDGDVDSDPDFQGNDQSDSSGKFGF